MSSADVLQQAIQAARSGRREEARALFLTIVEADSRNEIAWMWLAGLVDSLEDKMIACENVLTINPANEKVRAYLTKLQRQQETTLAEKQTEDATSLFQRAQEHADQNEIKAALQLARQALEKNDHYAEAWFLIGKLSTDTEQQLTALEKAYHLAPSNPEIAAAFQQARQLKVNPMSAAIHLEQLGKFEEALKVYEGLAAKAKTSKEFDHIYKQIIRLEGLKKEQIQYVAPSSSITRLTFVWPLLYLSLVLMQVGLKPFAHPAFYLWLGLPWVIIGSFLLSLAEVRSRHVLWKKIFGEHEDGSDFARLVAATAGWFLILLPHVLLVLDSLNRLRLFKIPPMPL